VLNINLWRTPPTPPLYIFRPRQIRAFYFLVKIGVAPNMFKINNIRTPPAPLAWKLSRAE
jgi:hypothetical protein